MIGTIIRDPRWKILGGVLLVYALLWHSLEGFGKAIDPISGGFFGDFVDHFYPEGRIIFFTPEPAGGFFYPPIAAILFGVIALLPRMGATMLWGALQLAALAALYFVPLKELPGLSQKQKSIYTLLFLTSMPVLHNLKWGQVEVMLTLGMFASLFLYKRGKIVLSSAVLACAISIKYYPAILLVYFVLRKDVRYVVMSLGMTLVFSLLVPAMIIGWQNTIRFTGNAASAGAGAASTWVARNPDSQAFAHVIYRCLELFPVGHGATIAMAGSFALAAIIILLWIVLKRDDRRPVGVFAPALLFAVIPFVTPTSWVHYFVFLPALQLYTLTDAIHEKSWSSLESTAKALLWIGSAALSNVGMLLLFSSWLDYTWYGPVLWADVMILILVFARTENDNKPVQAFSME